jgi:hypothetical protein
MAKQQTSDKVARTKKIKILSVKPRIQEKKKTTFTKPQTMQTKHINWECPKWVLPLTLG